MPVGSSPAVAPTIKSKSVAISASYPNLSMFADKSRHAGGLGDLMPDDIEALIV